jgi:hypothetical protein
MLRWRATSPRLLTIDVISTAIATMICNHMSPAVDVPVLFLLAVFWPCIWSHSNTDNDIAFAS